MSPVNLNDGFDNSLLHAFHAIQFFIEDPACFHWINGFKIVAFPLNIHHHGEGALRVTTFFGRDFVGTGNSEVSTSPKADIVRQRSSGTVHKISDRLDTGELHTVTGFLLILILNFFFRCIAGEETLNHKL